MTRFSFFSRALVLAGVGSGLALAAVTVSAQQAPQTMPTPRYQTPGIAAPAGPVPAPVFPTTPAITPNGEVAEEVIARVNDQIISRSDLMRGEDLLQQEIAQGGAQAGDAADRQRNLLRDLIDQQLLISKAKELNINPDAELTRRLDEIRKQNNLPTMEALEQAARRQGVSYEDFKSNIRNQIMTQSVVRDEVGRNIHMTHADEERFYEAHKAEFAMPEQVKLSEILVPVSATATDAEIEQAKTKADAIYNKLKGGADFAATAKAESGGPTAAQGGDLGVFKRGQLAKVLEDRTFAQQTGEFTDPIRTRQGFVILKTVDHVQAGTPSLDKIESDVQNAMYQDQIQPALRAYLTKLREDSYVDVRPGFVDSGASPKQTKPVFTAYTAPVPKKKTENKRRLIAARDRARLQDAGLTAKGNTVQPLANVQLDKHGKPKKVKREKVRFGQAPREALPDEISDAATTTTTGTREPSASGQDALGMPGTNPAVAATGVNAGAFGSGSGAGTAAASGSGNGAPGTALAPVSTNNTVNVASESDPLTPLAPARKKTRFSDREPEVKEKKKEVKVDKTIARVTAKPDPATTAEKQDAAQQQTALGLAGDTSKKKKKRQKGEDKQRLQQTTPEKKPDLVDNGLPDRLHQQNGPQQTTGTPSASSATGNLPAENSKEEDKQRRGRQPVTDPAKDASPLPTDAQPPAGTTLPAGTPTQNGTTTPGPGTLTPNPTAPPQ
ncbi:peptidylprolyl isomerase [Terriglobus aquaticus]|uniref:peptidylprolyl isomerase n=1 Tax=Terriglobus aquaticus TaxID=940139 RepID=A0ABW9KPX8_9BACT|nr:peptidylprolyl isomerase [Terriglobus aquaticus]